MSLNIKQYNGKWQLHIDEVWEFENADLLFMVARKLADFKEKHGRLEGNKK